MATATYVPLATQTLGSAASSITLSSIPSGYTDLRISFPHSISSTSGYSGYLQFNGDTGNNYSWTVILGNGSGTSSSSPTGQGYIQIDGMGISNSNQPLLTSVDIFSYTGSTYKSVLINVSGDNNGTGYVQTSVGLWRSTSSITSIKLYTGNTFAAGSTATLWGI
jgi:hypothetical protein